MPSIFTPLVNQVIRLTVRNIIHPDSDLESQRARAEKLDRIVGWLDHGFVRQNVTLTGELPAQYIKTPVSQPDRILLWLHGGGFCIRSPNLHGRQLARICQGTRATGLMPDYRLAPKHPYPAAYDDSWTAYNYLIESGCKPESMVVAGDSAGGTLTLALLLRLRDKGMPMPACAVMLSPSLDPTLSGDSAKENANIDSMLSIEGIQAFTQAYMPGMDFSDPRINLLEADYHGLPPLLFQVGSIEILRDDSVRAAEKAKADGVQAKLQVWEGMPHVFQAIEFLPEARQAVGDIVSFINMNL